jgi:polyribonucleotide nucleotidyltransferase
MFSINSEKIDWNGKEISIETGKVARQADGAVIVRFGETTVLCTTVFSKNVSDEASFFPLTINYQEKFYASGKIPGGFLKREGKPSDREILISRLIDRPIRPLFPSGFLNEVQVVCTVLSFDEKCDPGIAAMIGASSSLSISGIPFMGPIAGCRVGYIRNVGFVLNPTIPMELDLVVAGTSHGVLMVESEASELSEKIMADAVMFGFDSFQPVLNMIGRLREKAGKPVISFTPFEERYGELAQMVRGASIQEIRDALRITDKHTRREAIESAKERVLSSVDGDEVAINMLFEKTLSTEMRSSVLNSGKRIDGRDPCQIREISCEIDVLPKVHGSALFTRGETQAIVVSTLGSSSDEQVLDNIEGESRERFMLHYNFPPYSVGETGRLGAPGRREIGHGRLAWRALSPTLPSKDDFPYTIRVVSDVTESNGSSSMATVCGASLSMMAAGVKLRGAVAGIAMGLVQDEDGYVILSDIMGDEDHLGDMDFKVAGTKDGITALQMDIKVTSITRGIIEEALERARVGRLHILDIMERAIGSGRAELSENAPRLEVILIDKEKIRDLIGPGGKIIKEICDRTKVKIDVKDDGAVSVFSSDRRRMAEAIEMIKSACCPPDIGAVFSGKVVKVVEFGAFISIGNNKEGLVHISNISDGKVVSVSEVLKHGQDVRVKVIGVDERGKIKLSMKGM